MTDRMQQVQDVLDAAGGTHSFEDVMAMIESGAMQSFSDGDTWVVTQIVECPRKTVLEVFMVVGTLDGVARLEPAINDFAALVGAQLIRAFGRDGWIREHKKYGWRNGYRLFFKEI